MTIALIMTGLVAALILTEWRGPKEVDAISGSVRWPLLFSVVVIALGGVSVGLSIAAVRSRPVSRLLLSFLFLAILLVTLDSLPSSSARPWLVSLGIACGAFAIVDLTRSRTAMAAQAALAFLPFAFVAVQVATADGGADPLVRGRTESLADFAAIAVAALATFALAAALQANHQRTNRLIQRRVTIRAVVIALAIKVLVLCALYLHLVGQAFGGEQLWQIRANHPLSWLHAAVIAGLIVGVTARSWRRPLISRGFVPRLAAICVAAALMELAAIASQIAIHMVGSVSPHSATPWFHTAPVWVIDHNPQLQLGFGVAILAFALAEVAVRRPWTIGSYLWLVAGAWLVPPLVGIAMFSDADITFWASPGQVDIALTALVVLLVCAKRALIAEP